MNLHLMFGITIFIMAVLSFMAVVDERKGGRVTILIIQIAGYSIIVLYAITISLASNSLDL